MFIKRVQIEEGFLDGFDTELRQGLNVVIGARGTGKTSLIELIRFALGVPGNTSEVTRRSRDHALSVLGSGQITVTLETQSENSITVTRSANDESPRSTGMFSRPVIFSQTEIETVGLQAAGRLQLIDSFASSGALSAGVEQQAVAEFGSVNVEVEKLRRELDELERHLETRPKLALELNAVSLAEQSLAHTSQAISEQKNRLDQYTQQIATMAVFATEGARLLQNLQRWISRVDSAISEAPDLTSQIRTNFPIVGSIAETSLNQLRATKNALSEAYGTVKTAVDEKSAEKLMLEDAARHVRKELEGLSEGAGQVLRQGQQLREQKAKLESLAEYYSSRKATLSALLETRNLILDKIDNARMERFARRCKTVKELNDRLGPKIRIEIVRNAQVQSFAGAIADALRGSNLRFNEIAKAIAEKLSPRALLDAVETFDQELIAEVANISSDRAARVLTHLRSIDLGEIGCIDVEDNANFQLLDGKDYKDFSALSTGQRCTVVLPLILAHKDRIIIVDQPEDHIDNAFIADTLIKAISSRDPDGQLIFSTHNPNIPVLGSADEVIQLGSDGKRGFKLTSGPLEQPSVIAAISNVMEGGADAFARRSAFYRSLRDNG